MHAARFVVVIALCLTATLAQAAGFRFIDVPADADGPALKGAMWYPCAEPPGEINLVGMPVPGVKDCRISGEKGAAPDGGHSRRRSPLGLGRPDRITKPGSILHGGG